MKKMLFILILVTITVGFCIAQSTVWKVKGKGTEMYLGGSVHALREKDYPLPVEFDKAFNSSKILVLETNINEIDVPNRRRILIGLSLYPKDISLKTELNEDVYAALDSACSKFNMKLERFIKYKPSYVIRYLTMLELREIEVKSSVGVDLYFLNKALKEGKELLFLESLESQIELGAKMGEENENDFVLYSLRDLENYSVFIEEIILSWKLGDLARFEQHIIDFKADYPEIYQLLLVERNKNWLPKLEHYLISEEVEFVLFGALHLYGEDGIIQILKSKGYKVEQATF